MSISYQQLQEAIASIEMHHFRQTPVVACCLLRTNGRVVLGIGSPREGEPFDITAVAAQAKTAAEQQLAGELERELNPAPPEMQPVEAPKLKSIPAIRATRRKGGK